MNSRRFSRNYTQDIELARLRQVVREPFHNGRPQANAAEVTVRRVITGGADTRPARPDLL